MAMFCWPLTSLGFDWTLYRTIIVDQRGGKTESERFTRLVAMTIWTGNVDQRWLTFMVLNKAQVEPEALDDAYHLLLQRPALQNEREQLFVDKMNIPDRYGMVTHDSEYDVLALLLGKMIHGLPMPQVENIGLVIAIGLYNVYRQNLRLKEGVG